MTNNELVGLLFLDKVNRIIYVVYKGTSQQVRADLINDFKIGLAHFMHKTLAFVGTAKWAKKTVKKTFKNTKIIKLISKSVMELKKFRDLYDTIVVTGHSLGGFMAQIAYQKIVASDIGSIGNTLLVTFNAPGIGYL